MDALGDFISRRKWLKPVETALGAVADTLFLKDIPLGGKLRNFFHGTWFGHPLHPVITDVPLGAWTTGVIADYMAITTNILPRNTGTVALAVGVVASAEAWESSTFPAWSRAVLRKA